MAIYKDIVNRIPISAEKKTKQKQYLSCGVLPIIDQGQQIIGGYTDDISKKIDCDLPVIVFGDHTRCVKLIKFAFAPGADGIKVVRPVDNSVLIEYLFYATKYLTTKIRDKGYARHYQDVEKQELEIPTVLKQKEIVLKLEKDLSSLDNAVETLNKTKEQLAVYRQAVLKEAFGKFTEKKRIKEVSNFVTSGSRGWAKYYSGTGARFIRITDMTRDGITLKDDNIQHVKLPENAEGKRSRLKGNDVLVSITADLGSIALMPENIQEAYINQHIAMIRFNNSMQGKFMAWYLKSDYGQKDLLKNKRGGGKLGLGLDDIRDTLVPIVDNEEAMMTVNQIDARLSACDNIKNSIDVIQKQAEAMRQSILKEAFEGRVV